MKPLGICIVLLGLVGLSFGQGFTAFVFETDTVLTTGCDPATPPIPDGTLYYFYHDVNGNGATDDDPLVTLCDEPPDCITGPAGTFNLNSLPMNGGEMLGQAGTFYPEWGFVSAGLIPTPNRFYVRVYYPSISDPEVIWNSGVFSCVPGLNDIELSDWTCVHILCCACIPEAAIFMPHPTLDPLGSEGVCTALCHDNGGLHDVYVGPFPIECLDLFPSGFRPPLYFTTEIDYCTTCSADGSADPTWVYQNETGGWVVINGEYYLHGQVLLHPDGPAGCIRIRPDYLLGGGGGDCWLPVSFGVFAAAPGDGEATLEWNTFSETGVNYFEISRDGTSIRREEATNTSHEQHYRYTDAGLVNGRTYRYTLEVVNEDGSRELLATQNATPTAGVGLVTEYALYQNYPNPFNPATSIGFDLVDAGFVTLKVYNLVGQEVANVVSGTMSAGHHVVSFDATDLPTGAYLYRLEANGFSAVQKMLLMK